MKEKCSNHPDKRAISFCHSCGKYYCDVCLVVGAEYYYCYDKQCLDAKSKDEATTLNKLEAEKSEAALSATNFKRKFFRDTLIFLILSSPIYFFACFIIADPRLKTIGVISLMTLLACGKAFIANIIIGFATHALFKKMKGKKNLVRIVFSSLQFLSLFLSLAWKR